MRRRRLFLLLLRTLRFETRRTILLVLMVSTTTAVIPPEFYSGVGKRENEGKNQKGKNVKNVVVRSNWSFLFGDLVVVVVVVVVPGGRHFCEYSRDYRGGGRRKNKSVIDLHHFSHNNK